MPYIINLIQEIFLYFTTLLILIAVLNGLKGSTQVQMFEKKHLSRLRFISSLTYLNLIFALVLSIIQVLQSDDAPNFNKVFGFDTMLLFLVSLCSTLGVGKVRNTLVHGKKYKTVLFYFGIALLLMIALIVYLKLGKDASFIF
jgi:hypothetical protein